MGKSMLLYLLHNCDFRIANGDGLIVVNYWCILCAVCFASLASYHRV